MTNYTIILKQMQEYIKKQTISPKHHNIYRLKDNNGWQSAIGCLIPDFIYSQGMEYQSIEDLLLYYPQVCPYLGVNINVLEKCFDMNTGEGYGKARKILTDYVDFLQEIHAIPFFEAKEVEKFLNRVL